MFMSVLWSYPSKQTLITAWLYCEGDKLKKIDVFDNVQGVHKYNYKGLSFSMMVWGMEIDHLQGE